MYQGHECQSCQQCERIRNAPAKQVVQTFLEDFRKMQEEIGFEAFIGIAVPADSEKFKELMAAMHGG